MSLISFPLTYANVDNRYFQVAPVVAISGGIKSELNYLVLSDRSSIVTVNFGATFTSESGGNVNQINSYPFVLTDFLKPNDLVFARYTAVSSGGINPTFTFTWLYQVNGVTVHTDTKTFFAASSTVRTSVSTTIHALELK